MSLRPSFPQPSRIPTGTVPHLQINPPAPGYRVKELDLVGAGNIRENADSDRHSLSSCCDTPPPAEKLTTGARLVTGRQAKQNVHRSRECPISGVFLTRSQSSVTLLFRVRQDVLSKHGIIGEAFPIEGREPVSRSEKNRVDVSLGRWVMNLNQPHQSVFHQQPS